MTFYFDSQQAAASDLINWPPLRIYTKETKAQLLPVSELVYLESDRNYTWLQWVEGQRLMAPYTLKRFQEQLPPIWFIRLNRHLLVNRRFVARIENGTEGPRIFLTTGSAFTISRRQWIQLRKEFTINAKPALIE